MNTRRTSLVAQAAQRSATSSRSSSFKEPVETASQRVSRLLSICWDQLEDCVPGLSVAALLEDGTDTVLQTKAAAGVTVQPAALDALLGGIHRARRRFADMAQETVQQPPASGTSFALGDAGEGVGGSVVVTDFVARSGGSLLIYVHFDDDRTLCIMAEGDAASIELFELAPIKMRLHAALTAATLPAPSPS